MQTYLITSLSLADKNERALFQDLVLFKQENKSQFNVNYPWKQDILINDENQNWPASGLLRDT